MPGYAAGAALMPSPMLDPPCPGWKRDLPGPTDPPKALGGPEQPPNYLDGIYLELSDVLRVSEEPLL